jgi:hypothetical protein
MSAKDLRRILTGYHLVGPLLLLFAAAALGGCAGVTVNSSWQGSASHDQSFSKVLIVGVTPNYDTRCAFEWALASQIRGGTTQALVSCDSMPKDVPLTRENIERVVASVQADAVLATRLVAAKVGLGQSGSMDTRGAGYYKPTDYGFGYDYGYAGGFGGYGMPVVYGEFQEAPALSSIHGEVHVSSNLYETKNATLIYQMDTKGSSKNLDSTADAMLTVSAPIADRLRRDDLIH